MSRLHSTILPNGPVPYEFEKPVEHWLLTMPDMRIRAYGGYGNDDDGVVYASPEEQQAYSARWKGYHVPLGFEETQEGVYHNFNTGETLINYPGITVTGEASKRKTPSYYDVNHDYASSYNPNGLMEFADATVVMPLRQTVLSFPSKFIDTTIEDLKDYWTQRKLRMYEEESRRAGSKMLRLPDDMDEEERRYWAHLHNIKDRPYSFKLDAFESGKYPDEPRYLSRLGQMGLTKERGTDEWYLLDEDGQRVKQCAEFANRFNSMVKIPSEGTPWTEPSRIPTAGDAWTASGIYGDSVLYGNTNKPTKLPMWINDQLMFSRRVRHIDRDNLQTGDIVDLHRVGSSYNRRAAREGRGNSHTGRIYKPIGMNGPTYVIHNEGGHIKVDPIGLFIGPRSKCRSKWGITRIARPGTQYHPYNK